MKSGKAGRGGAHGPRDQRAYAMAHGPMEATWAPSGFEFTPGCEHSHLNCTMSSPLADVWEAAAASPFQPTIGKDTQFTLGFALLFACTFLRLSVQATRRL